jgi:hypothetical protein
LIDAPFFAQSVFFFMIANMVSSTLAIPMALILPEFRIVSLGVLPTNPSASAMP